MGCGISRPPTFTSAGHGVITKKRRLGGAPPDGAGRIVSRVQETEAALPPPPILPGDVGGRGPGTHIPRSPDVSVGIFVLKASASGGITWTPPRPHPEFSPPGKNCNNNWVSILGEARMFGWRWHRRHGPGTLRLALAPQIGTGTPYWPHYFSCYW